MAGLWRNNLWKTKKKMDSILKRFEGSSSIRIVGEIIRQTWSEPNCEGVDDLGGYITTESPYNKMLFPFVYPRNVFFLLCVDVDMYSPCEF